MKTYNFEMAANAPILKGAVMECANESRTAKALAVFNTLEMMGIELQTALYKRVAKKYVDSDKAVMMAFAEYQVKTTAPAALDAIDQKLREIAVATPDNRTRAMRNIFDYCHANGITDAGAMRKRCENALNYHNTGRIYNTWKEWESARIAEVKAAKAAARKAKREAKKAEAAAAAKAVATKPVPLFFDVTFVTDSKDSIEDFTNRYNDCIVNCHYGVCASTFRFHAVESVFDDVVRYYSEEESGFNVDASRNGYTISIEVAEHDESETDDKVNMLLRAARTAPTAPAERVIMNMVRSGRLVIG